MDIIFPIFTTNRVLKRESIEYLRDFPNDMVSLGYETYSDGVLFGFSVSVDKGVDKKNLIVSKGAIKFEKRIYSIPQTLVSFSEYNRNLCLKLVIGDLFRNDDFEIRPIEHKLCEIGDISKNDIELGRFRLAKGARLRCLYDSVADFRTQENTLDITHVPYAGYGAQTLHPKILKAFGEVLLQNSSDPVDLAFGFLCINSSIIHKQTIEGYLAQKSGGYVEYSLDEICDNLIMLSRKNARGAGMNKHGKRRGPSIS